MPEQDQLHQILRSKFGHTEFRVDQEKIIKHVLSGQSALALMPTGMGKSLCYQLPAVVFHQHDQGLVLVISPLIALMQDQTQKARSHGLDATFINSSLTREEREIRQAKLVRGRYQLLFVTPERFRQQDFRQTIAKRKIALLAVDEAHCISQWGHDFRPDYSRLGEIRIQLGKPPVLALTATATPEVQKDILHQLEIPDAPIFSTGITRENLQLSVHDVYGLDEKIRSFVGLRHVCPGACIVYFSLIQTLYKFSDALEKLSIRHLIYHGQLPGPERARQLNLFIKNENELILATPAFGLGIDKPNIRLLVHAEMPSNIESYYQEVGRAGRDGLVSEGHLLYEKDDASIAMDFIKWANPGAEFVRQVYHLIAGGGPRLAEDGLEFLRRQMNFYNSRDFRVETSLNLLERMDCIAEDSSRLGFGAVREPSQDELKSTINDERTTTQNKKLLDMIQYSENQTECRMQIIHRYFGLQTQSCRVCDNCRKAGAI